ncbi:hypothetical protein Ae201684P_006798 [Aphanomyces euteiches]|uniref:Tc1-like transposase DDE domain-containing protein n=1 Tax=Aphanomyces euteiches TaxID=100861 RepID=A0A6G0X8B7_9STRA|nr:hypothetical protein Ae201684_007249 [Aphanomyces euteiches]KAH9100602.1 hypothetical protein Ae201684P_006798 [Aphanomyces euteiches]KAH9155781.1 hypothetical protein AeRB84_002278 [Aphanomyces euteiches]
MVWGAINFNGVGALRFCDGKMKSEDYKCLLDDELGDNAAKFGLPLDFVFQLDKAPIHKTALVSKFLDENMIETLDHPPQGPDLNPIKHVWEFISRRLRELHATSVESLKARIMTIWDQIPQDYIQKLILSMPKRMEDVILAKGGSTKY